MSVTAYILLGCRTATGVPENIMLAILKCGVLIENPEFRSEAKKSENTPPKAETTQVCIICQHFFHRYYDVINFWAKNSKKIKIIVES